MKMRHARELIVKKSGYRVRFDRRGMGVLESDFFPDRDEPAITELDVAWTLAGQWAQVDPTIYVNIYVISAADGTPVEDYLQRKLNTYPGPPQPGAEIDPGVHTRET